MFKMVKPSIGCLFVLIISSLFSGSHGATSCYVFSCTNCLATYNSATWLTNRNYLQTCDSATSMCKLSVTTDTGSTDTTVSQACVVTASCTAGSTTTGTSTTAVTCSAPITTGTQKSCISGTSATTFLSSQCLNANYCYKYSQNGATVKGCDESSLLCSKTGDNTVLGISYSCCNDKTDCNKASSSLSFSVAASLLLATLVSLKAIL